ncbi:MAG TPA: Stp1/IreP family PP2C-type Ser/Thr phosphatase [Ktedonobacteraceae bacterium]|jgi:protein phosphatase
MTSTRLPRQVALADRCYRLLLLTYPTPFRQIYGYEMAQAFRAGCCEALHAAGGLGMLRLCGFTLGDLIVSALKEHGRALLLRLKQLAGVFSPTGLDALALAAPLHLQVAQRTDLGRKRGVNEDNLVTVLPEDPQVFKEKGALFVVADGMGGHTRGERASEFAVATVREVYYREAHREIVPLLVHAFEQANARIYAETPPIDRQGDTQVSMATTCIAAVLQDQTLTVANVGDSRVYVVHAGQIRQVSRDHSLVADMVRAGTLTPEQARYHEKRNIIYRCLGTQAQVEVDVFVEEVAQGDRILLCTDGLSGQLDDEEILRIVETSSPQDCVGELIARANATGGPDNITAIVVHVTAS